MLAILSTRLSGYGVKITVVKEYLSYLMRHANTVSHPQETEVSREPSQSRSAIFSSQNCLGRWRSDLDAGSAPATAAGGGSVTDNSTAAGAVHNPKAEDGTGEPEDGGEEAEGDIRLPFLARAILRNVRPVENRAAVKGADESNQETEGDEPANGE